MPRLSLRIVAVILIPCLLVDSSTAYGATLARLSASPEFNLPVFTTQALELAALMQQQPIHPSASSSEKRSAGQFLQESIPIGAEWIPMFLERIGFKSLSDVPRDTKLFDDWLHGKQIPQKMALDFAKLAADGARQKSKLSVEQQAKDLNEVAKTVNRNRYFKKRLIKNGIFADSPRLRYLIDANQPAERILIVEAIDSTDDYPSGAHYMREADEQILPVYRLQIQSGAIKGGRLDDVLVRVIIATGWRALGYPEPIANDKARHLIWPGKTGRRDDKDLDRGPYSPGIETEDTPPNPPSADPKRPRRGRIRASPIIALTVALVGAALTFRRAFGIDTFTSFALPVGWDWLLGPAIFVTLLALAIGIGLRIRKADRAREAERRALLQPMFSNWQDLRAKTMAAMDELEALLKEDRRRAETDFKELRQLMSRNVWPALDNIAMDYRQVLDHFESRAALIRCHLNNAADILPMLAGYESDIRAIEKVMSRARFNQRMRQRLVEDVHLNARPGAVDAVLARIEGSLDTERPNARGWWGRLWALVKRLRGHASMLLAPLVLAGFLGQDAPKPLPLALPGAA